MHVATLSGSTDERRVPFGAEISAGAGCACDTGAVYVLAPERSHRRQACSNKALAAPKA